MGRNQQGAGHSAMEQASMMHRTKNRAAFTLVELLAAMAVLAIMMLMFANVFSSSSKAWTSGTRRTEQNMNGRAVLEYMYKEIGQAIVNTNGIVFQIVNPGAPYSLATYGAPATPNTALHFVAPIGCNSATTPDEARLVHYYVTQDATATDYKNFQLMRVQTSARTTLDTAYKSTAMTPTWISDKSGAGVFIDHISQFYVVANGNKTTFNSKSMTPQQLPQYVDIIIGFLSEDDARKASLLTGAAQFAYVTKAEKRFTRRVYMQNRTGYLPVQ